MTDGLVEALQSAEGLRNTVEHALKEVRGFIRLLERLVGQQQCASVTLGTRMRHKSGRQYFTVIDILARQSQTGIYEASLPPRLLLQRSKKDGTLYHEYPVETVYWERDYAMVTRPTQETTHDT